MVLTKAAGNPPQNLFWCYRSKHAAVGAFQGVISFEHTRSGWGCGNNTLDNAQILMIWVPGHNNMVGLRQSVPVSVGVN